MWNCYKWDKNETDELQLFKNKYGQLILIDNKIRKIQKQYFYVPIAKVENFQKIYHKRS